MTVSLIDHRRRAVADARDMVEIDVQLLHQIDRAVGAERRHRHARLGVERHEIEAGGDDENPLLLAVRPIGDAAPGIASRRLAVAAVFVDPFPQPQLLARRRVDGGHHALAAGGLVQNAVGHDRRGFAPIDRERRVAIALRGAAERGRRRRDGGLPAPGDLQILEIVLVDLVERRDSACSADRRSNSATRRALR